MPNVPNNESFSLIDVYDAVHGHAVSTTGDLVSCFSNSVPAYFDPIYNQVSYAPANSMKRFRNYTISAAVATVSMSITFSSHSSAGVYDYSGILTVDAPQAMSVGVLFELDFLTGSVPPGQSEYRSTSISIPLFPSSITGAGTITSYTKPYTAGVTNTAFTIRYINDNWSSPRPLSNFRVRLMPLTNAILSVPNSTVTNGSTHVVSIYGVESVIFTTAPIYGSYSNSFSGQMNYIGLVPTVLGGGSQYSSDVYKDPIISETFNTSGFSTNKKFAIHTLFDTVSNNALQNGSYTDGNTPISTISLSSIGINGFGANIYKSYALINQNGTDTNFSYSISALKYCQFSTLLYTQTIKNLIPGGHVIYVNAFAGNNDYLPDMVVFPGNDNLLDTELLEYKLKAHCPTGSYLRIFITGDVVVLYDGDEWSGYGTTHEFRGVTNTDSRARTTIAGQGWAPQRKIIFQQTDQWVEILPVSSNIVVNNNFPNKVGYYGII